MRILYRVRQFWQALAAAPSSDDLEQAHDLLSPQLLALFLRMQPSEQAHSLVILRQLREQKETNPDLLAAALLHDIGKICHPLSIWERTIIVLGKAFFPEQRRRWGQAAPRGWRRAFVIAEQHPAWGAEMAAQAGASPLTVALIQRHQEFPPEQQNLKNGSFEDQLLYRLQLLDNES